MLIDFPIVKLQNPVMLVMLLKFDDPLCCTTRELMRIQIKWYRQWFLHHHHTASLCARLDQYRRLSLRPTTKSHSLDYLISNKCVSSVERGKSQQLPAYWNNNRHFLHIVVLGVVSNARPCTVCYFCLMYGYAVLSFCTSCCVFICFYVRMRLFMLCFFNVCAVVGWYFVSLYGPSSNVLMITVWWLHCFLLSRRLDKKMNSRSTTGETSTPKNQ